MLTQFQRIKNILGLLFLAVIFFALNVLVSIMLVSLLIVPLTWLWGKLTGQSYDRVCDNSEIVYKLNQIGKWVWVITIGSLIILLISSIFQNLI